MDVTRATHKGHGRPDRMMYDGYGLKPNGEPVAAEVTVDHGMISVSRLMDGMTIVTFGCAMKFWGAPMPVAEAVPTPVETVVPDVDGAPVRVGDKVTVRGRDYGLAAATPEAAPATRTSRPRGYCHFCASERVIKAGGLLVAHRDGNDRCPGGNHTPEETRAATRVPDSAGHNLAVGARVVATVNGRITAAIVTMIEFDHPGDFDRGAAWVEMDLVTIDPDGTAVSVTERRWTQRSTRVTRVPAGGCDSHVTL